MINIPDELLVVDYDADNGTHIGGLRNDVFIHLCTAFRDHENRLLPPRRTDHATEQTLAEVDCPRCLSLLEEIRSHS